MKEVKKLNMLKKLTMEYTQLLDDAKHIGEITVDTVGRVFTETMHNGKYHFSQINNPIYWSLVNQDFNITLCTNGSNVELFNIAVIKKGNGLGTEILNLLLDAADKTGIRINLNACATEVTEHLESYHLNNQAAGIDNFIPINDELTKATDRLIEYYETLGFRSYGKKFQMIYTPQK